MRASTVLGAFAALRAAYDQGSGATERPCAWKPAFGAYQCLPGGIWADPQPLVSA
jgi:hypothetical protein